jgi:hypothetical protein
MTFPYSIALNTSFYLIRCAHFCVTIGRTTAAIFTAVKIAAVLFLLSFHIGSAPTQPMSPVPLAFAFLIELTLSRFIQSHNL